MIKHYTGYIIVCVMALCCSDMQGSQNSYSAQAYTKKTKTPPKKHYLGQQRPLTVKPKKTPIPRVVPVSSVTTDVPLVTVKPDVVTPAPAQTTTTTTTTDAGSTTLPLLTLQQQTDLYGPRLRSEWDLLLNTQNGALFTVLSGNLHLFPPVIAHFGTEMKDAVGRAKKMGQTVKKWYQEATSKDKIFNPNNFVEVFDVIVAQEAWDKDCRTAFYNEVKDLYPYMVADEYQSVLAKVGLDVLLGSGLAIYSRHALRPIKTRDGKTQNYMYEPFFDYRGDECFAHKGFLLVKILVGPDKDIPVYIATTHLQAGASDVDRRYLQGASRKSTRDVAKDEMNQIKSAIEFIMMNDYYPEELDKICKSCKIDNGFFDKYFWNVGKKISSKFNFLVFGDRSATTNEQKEAACAQAKIKEFIAKTPGFWDKAYVFVSGDYNIGFLETNAEGVVVPDDEYNNILEVFGKNSPTIMPAARLMSTSFKDLNAGTLKKTHMIDHVISCGRSVLRKKDGTLVGGSWPSNIFDNTMTDHVAMQLGVRLTKPGTPTIGA